MVDHIFPPKDFGSCGGKKSFAPLNQYSSAIFWQNPIPTLDIENELKRLKEDQQQSGKSPRKISKSYTTSY